MDFNFRLQSKPFSINNYHYRDKRHKTADARAWELEILRQLEQELGLIEVVKQYQEKGGYFVLSFHAYYPAHIFRTQEGELSGRTIDITNYEKPLQDLLFKVLNLNDKLVKKLISEKSEGTHHYIDVQLTLVYD